MIEVISASKYYGSGRVGTVLLVDGHPRHFTGPNCGKEARAAARRLFARRQPIQDRIRAAYTESREYQTLLQLVFPPEVFPRAHCTSNNGGPPGCAMAFGRALAKMGGERRGNKIWIPRQ